MSQKISHVENSGPSHVLYDLFSFFFSLLKFYLFILVICLLFLLIFIGV